MSSFSDPALILPATVGFTELKSEIFDAQKLLASTAILPPFNLLKLYNTTMFVQTLSGTGSITPSLANGTLQLSTPANNDDTFTVESAKYAITDLPRIAVFKVNSITVNGATTQIAFGLGTGTSMIGTNQHLSVVTPDGGTNWYASRSAGVTETQNPITGGVAANDVFVFYISTSYTALWKNGTLVVGGSANVPTVAIGHAAEILTTVGLGANSQITLGFMG